MFQILILPVPIILVKKDILIVVEVDMIRNSPLFDGNFVDEPFLFLALSHEGGLKHSASVHDIFFNLSEDSIDSFSIIFACIFFFDLSDLFVFQVIEKSHVELVSLKVFHSVIVFWVRMLFGLNILNEVLIP